MKIKQVPNKCFYCIEKELTIPEIAEFSEKTVQTLYEDADSKGLDIISIVNVNVISTKYEFIMICMSP